MLKELVKKSPRRPLLFSRGKASITWENYKQSCFTPPFLFGNTLQTIRKEGDYNFYLQMRL